MSINLRFLVEFQRQQTPATNITHFTIQLCSKNTTHFTKVNSLNIMKNILPQDSQKPYSPYKFSSKFVSGWYQIKHLHCTISRCPETSFGKRVESKCLYIPVNLRKKIFVPPDM